MPNAPTNAHASPAKGRPAVAPRRRGILQLKPFAIPASALALLFISAAPSTNPAARIPQEISSPLGHKLSLKFHDEFDPIPDTDTKPYIDRSKWQSTFWQGSSERTLLGNLEAQYYTDKDYAGANNLPASKRLNPFSFDQPGLLTISATKVPEALWKNYWMGNERPFSSGLLISDKHFTFQYGYVEGRFKLPSNRGSWPAFWLLQNDPTKKDPAAAHAWPPEVDIFEFFGHRPTKHSSGVIVPKDEPKPSFNFGYNETNTDLTKDFHTWAFEWDANTMVWLLDGKEWTRTQTPAAMNRPFYLLINLAVGGKWYSEEMKAAHHDYKPWEVDEASMPWKMQCDFVRVYQ